VARPECPTDTFRVFGYPALLTVAGKGAVEVLVADTNECFGLGAVLNPTQAFTITGGSGLYAGASGSGTVQHRASFRDPGAVGEDTWNGTLVVPGLDFDVTAPTLSGAAGKTVRAPRRAKRVRVRYNVTARDEIDGAVPVSCRPKSGSRFKIGRTVVSCSATDTSGNTGKATFKVTVKPRQGASRGVARTVALYVAPRLFAPPGRATRSAAYQGLPRDGPGRSRTSARRFEVAPATETA
jgi:hypothetical protein